MKRDANDVAGELGVEALRQQTELLAAAAMENFRPAGVDLAAHNATAAIDDPELLVPPEYVSTGFPALDSCLGGGLALGCTTNLFAPSSMGKSTVMANLCVQTSIQNFPSAIFSLEMRRKDIWALILSIMGGISRTHIRRLTLSPNEKNNLFETMNAVRTWPLTIIDRHSFAEKDGVTMNSLELVFKEGIRRFGWKVIYLDYLSKVGPHEEPDDIRIPKLSNWITIIAQRLNVHIVFLSQSNKASFGRKGKQGQKDIQLQDVSGRLEMVADADSVIGLVRNDWNSDKPQDTVELRAVVLKSRFGGGGAVKFDFYKTTGFIQEESRDENGSPPTEEQQAKAYFDNGLALFVSMLSSKWKSRSGIETEIRRATKRPEKEVHELLELICNSYGIKALEAMDGEQEHPQFWVKAKGMELLFREKSSTK